MSPPAYPDFAYIRKAVPIRAVAEALGLRIVGNTVQCWRPENHQHGDRTPSVGLSTRRNLARCFVCDAHALSPIDLVMSVRGVELRDAVRWIIARFGVPPAPKGRHIQHSGRWPERFRTGASGSRHEALVRSGLWASLTPCQRSLIPVLETFADPLTHKAKISYRGMMRYAGLRSQSTVSIALKRFCALHFLRVESNRDGEGLRACNTYELCFDDAEFLSLANECFQRHREEIERERELRKAVRKKSTTAKLLPVNSLSND